jgi:glyoxylase-like metal-dependent hydrolase (beta-lactamase superfamily II)
MEIVPGLHQLKTPMLGPALPYIMPYALAGSDGVTLIDSGFGTPEATVSLTAQLAVLGYAPGDARRLVITHAHPDHAGMAGWLKEQAPGCEVVMLQREWEWIQARWLDDDAWTELSDRWLVRHGLPQTEVDTARETGAMAPTSPRVRPGEPPPPPGGHDGNGARQPFRFVAPDRTLQDGDVIAFDGWELEAVWTPGHTPGHMCLYERNHRLMFTGDHVLPYISPNVSLHADQEGTSPLSDFRQSLRKVAAYEVAAGLPAHEFTIPDLPARCAVLLHHHDARLDEVRDAIGAVAATACEVSQRVRWNTGPFDDFNLFMKRAAIGETLSHLRLLADEGRARSIDDGHRVVWEQV